MNWRSIKYLTEDDYDKPLLFKMPYDEDIPVAYFAGYVEDGYIYSMAYVDDYGNENDHFIVALYQAPAETQYIRIDEILG